MNGLFTKGGRMIGVAALLLVAVTAGGAMAQKKPSAGAIGVGKCKNLAAEDCHATYKTIQEAVNNVPAGGIIEILDEEVYEEQVTIDGRDVSPWDGNNGGTIKKVVGGKNGITLRYVVDANAPWNHPRPIIRYKDINNIHPKTQAEARLDNELTGAGNFETNGALRVIRARSVTIEGIEVDGGGSFAFGAAGVWCDSAGRNCSPLNHGNAAITLAVASQVTIRDCDIKGAFIGINVKDRNTGGVFGNPNPADRDYTVPLSGFGQVGGHLFEYNKIHGNVLGFFFESAWDLGSSVRYNLIYDNKIDHAPSGWTVYGSEDEQKQKNGGAFMFKDMYLSPIAIYNNTFYDNTGNFVGHWQAGGQHLIFNNIFSKSSPSRNVDHMSLDGAFPYRMHYNVFSVDASKLQTAGGTEFNCAANADKAPGGYWVERINQTQNGFGEIQGTQTSFSDCRNAGQTQQRGYVRPGTLFPTMSANGTPVTLPANQEIRWLQTEGVGSTIPMLFKSVTASSADFLVPDWENAQVISYIKNKGWPAAGIRNNDGSIADLGAIPSTGIRQTTVARIIPTNVVLLSNNGANASANFSLRENSGTISNPKIKLLRWIAPVPENNTDATNWPSKVLVVPSGSITTLTNTSAVVVGNNTFSFATTKTTVPKYGFFEIIVEGKDANGNDVSSDIGFLPYRTLDYILEISVYDGSSRKVDTVLAGNTYRVEVIPKKSDGTPVNTPLNEVTYSLLSDPPTFMRYADGANKDKEFTEDKNMPAPAGRSYNVYFTQAAQETIMGAGLYESGTIRNVFLGTKNLVVKPGPAAKIEFKNPVPLSALGNPPGPAPVINRGVDFEVKVEVQDKFGNAVDNATPVTIVSDKPDIGTTRTASATSDNKGIALFMAYVVNGKTGDNFDMTASLSGGASDVGRLRLGRALDRLDVFYSDTAMTGTGTSAKTQYDPDAKIEGNVGEWFKITVRDVIDDTINIAQTDPKVVRVSTDVDGLVFSASAGGAPATEFPLTRGVATFWVTGTDAVSGACVDVDALVSTGGEVFSGISRGSRCDITFIKQSGSILRAVAFGDGHGRPDSVLVYYSEEKAGFGEGGISLPDRVEVSWLSVDPVVLTATGAMLSGNGHLLRVDLRNAAVRPSGYTSITGGGRGLVTVYGEDGEDGGFPVYDGIGPLVAKDGEAGGSSPVLVENLSPGVAQDTLYITVSEQLRNPATLIGKTLLYTADATPVNEPGAAAGGTALTVSDAWLNEGTTYGVAVEPIAGGLAAGGWIRFDPSGGVVDRGAAEEVDAGYSKPDNGPHAANRWVQLKLQEVAPTAKEAWYTANPATGKVDIVTVVFDKPINLEGWFKDGSVSFGRNDETKLTDAALPGVFSLEDEKTLKIDLSVAFKSSQTAVRTSGPIAFTLTYAPGTGWSAAAVNADDRAAPVLADAVTLKIGALKEDGSPNPDTLVVVYSERPGDASLAPEMKTPITIWTRGNTPCQPSLTLMGPVVSVGTGSLFYKATYLVDGDLEKQCPSFPEAGDSVSIDHDVRFGDNIDPPNEVSGYNLHQPLKIDRGPLKWAVTVRNNPFRSDAAASDAKRGASVKLEPGAKGAAEVAIKAHIMIFDNLGALVIDTLIETQKEVDWPWSGANKKGRLVGTGTYLFKAVCDAEIKNVSGAVEDKQRYAVSRQLGVVRGKN